MELSKFMNGDKKAIVERSDYNYTIVYYLNEKVIKKETTADYKQAEDMAEDYVLAEEKKGPSLLVEKWNDV
jgi:hypothetical protein